MIVTLLFQCDSSNVCLASVIGVDLQPFRCIWCSAMISQHKICYEANISFYYSGGEPQTVLFCWERDFISFHRSKGKICDKWIYELAHCFIDILMFYCHVLRGSLVDVIYIERNHEILCYFCFQLFCYCCRWQKLLHNQNEVLNLKSRIQQTQRGKMSRALNMWWVLSMTAVIQIATRGFYFSWTWSLGKLHAGIYVECIQSLFFSH